MQRWLLSLICIFSLTTIFAGTNITDLVDDNVDTADEVYIINRNFRNLDNNKVDKPISENLIPDKDNLRDLGSSTTFYRVIYVSTLNYIALNPPVSTGGGDNLGSHVSTKTITITFGFTTTTGTFTGDINASVSTATFDTVRISSQIGLNNLDYTFPSVRGTNTQVLTENGTGILSWLDAPGVGGDNLGSHIATKTLTIPFGITGTTATLTTLVEGGALFSDSVGQLVDNTTNFFWDNTNNTLFLGQRFQSAGLIVLSSSQNVIGPATPRLDATLTIGSETGVPLILRGSDDISDVLLEFITLDPTQTQGSAQHLDIVAALVVSNALVGQTRRAMLVALGEKEIFRVVETTTGLIGGGFFLFGTTDDTGMAQGSAKFDGVIRVSSSVAVSTPSYSFSGDDDTGIYHAGENNVSLVTGGQEWFRLDGNGLIGPPGIFISTINNVQIRAWTGVLSSLGITFSGDLDTGFYQPGENNIGLVTGGQEWFRLDGNGLMGPQGVLISTINNVQIRAWVGTASTPGLTFSGDDDTGIFRASDNNMAFVSGGIEHMRITANNIGFGITSPVSSAFMHISTNTPGGVAYAVRVDQNATDGLGFYVHFPNQSDDTQALLVDGSGGTAFRVETNGETGVQCNDPDNDLEVGGTGTGCNTGVGSFIAAGDGAWNTNSSIDIKENIRPLWTATDDILLTKLNTISPKMVDYKDQTEYHKELHKSILKVGRKNVPSFIAEEWNDFFHEGENKKSVNWTEVMLINYLSNQALLRQIQILKQQILLLQLK